MLNSKYSTAIRTLEAAGQFDQDVRPVDDKYVKPINVAKFNYRHRNPFWLLYSALVRGFVWLVGPLATWWAFDLRVKGKKHLRQLGKKGAVVVTNHVHLLDALMIRQISHTRRMYYLAAAYNNKKGLGGLTLKVAGVLPIGNSLKLARQLDTTVTYLLKHRRLLTVYAEESMWSGYEKIRPLKKGAFYYAVKNDSPVVPTVILFRPVKWWDKLLGRRVKVTLQILPPVFPDPTCDRPTNVTNLQTACHTAMVNCASHCYGYDADATHYQATTNTEPAE